MAFRLLASAPVGFSGRGQRFSSAGFLLAVRFHGRKRSRSFGQSHDVADGMSPQQQPISADGARDQHAHRLTGVLADKGRSAQQGRIEPAVHHHPESGVVHCLNGSLLLLAIRASLPTLHELPLLAVVLVSWLSKSRLVLLLVLSTVTQPVTATLQRFMDTSTILTVSPKQT